MTTRSRQAGGRARPRPIALGRLTLAPATAADAAAVAALRTAVGVALTHAFGKGPWSWGATERGVRFDMKRARVFIAKVRRRPVATLALATRKPFSIDRAYFTPCRRPLYLTSMAVMPDLQRLGLGRRCLEEAARIAREWPADAIRLDAFDATAGAGDFYHKNGYREVGRAIYRKVPLIYYELLLG